MNNLIYQATRQTPRLGFDHGSGVMTIAGRCIPESAHGFWHPVAQWINEYSSTPKEETVIRVHLDYVNTSSFKYFFDIMKMFDEIHKKDDPNRVKVEWYCDEDDDDMIEMGEDLQTMVKMPFEIKFLDQSGRSQISQ